MTYSGLFQRGPREVFVTDPETATTIKALRLQGAHPSAIHTTDGLSPKFGTKTTGIADPLGGTTAIRYTDDGNTVYHMIECGQLTGNGNWQGFPGEVAGGQVAKGICIRANTSTSVDVVYGNPATTSKVVDRFDLTTGAHTVDSGLGLVKIAPLFNDGGASGWWFLYTVNLRWQTPVNTAAMALFNLHTVNGAGVGWNGGSGYAGASNRSFDVWGYQAENANVMVGGLCSLGVTAPASQKWADTYGSENLSIPLVASLQTPAAMTIYTSHLERGNKIMANAAANTRQSGIYRLGDAGRSAINFVELIQTATGFTATLNNSGVTSTSSVAVSPAVFDKIELLTTISSTGAITLSSSVNGAAATAGATGTAAGLPGSWSEATLILNSCGDALFGDMDLIAAKSHTGVKTFTEARAA